MRNVSDSCCFGVSLSVSSMAAVDLNLVLLLLLLRENAPPVFVEVHDANDVDVRRRISPDADRRRVCDTMMLYLNEL